MDEVRLDLTADAQGGSLGAFSKALNRETHVLSQHPNLLWQQLYNRLQWEVEGVDIRLRKMSMRE